MPDGLAQEGRAPGRKMVKDALFVIERVMSHAWRHLHFQLPASIGRKQQRR
jgi:hypothetical protein